ncbi:DUF547 domain-containing protein [Agarivorans sp. TSD2052]|uniref:DUF547 domain-containing protein n=1 Tax=Agarivorans sp. TSD2052 TaxID=2937286 RepID=UPI00200E1B62|nr:DUF547 domain-containing protein [Agarivorans sp. TSD2052]UPW16822.1 DUF547 domain-containing protein [Agarivorans sp. TSD2052]
MSLISSPVAIAETFDHSNWDNLLNEYVHWPVANQESRVDYANFDQAKLEQYLDTVAAIRQQQFNAWGDDEQLAFLINAYNAYTVQFILTAYPNINSIRDLGNLFQSPWKKKRFSLFGEQVSLDHIEHQLIRPVYNNPLIHAAVVCAAISCPPLQSVAYTGEQLQQQLSQAFRAFLRSNKNYYDPTSKKLKLSSIFKWYKDDFGNDLNLYLSQYAEDLRAEANIIEQASVSYLDYDWSLNAYP